MKKKNNGFLFIIILAIIGGMVAGVFGELATRAYLLEDLYVPYIGQEFDLANLNSGRSSLVIRDAKKVVVNQDIKVDETIKSIKPSLLGVHKKLSATNTLGYYDLDNPLFIALTVTSDGWLVASAPTEIKKVFSVQNYVVISSDRQIYTIDVVADFEDLPGDLVFFHLKEVSNLPVKKNIQRNELSLGKTLLVLNSFNDALLTSISSLEKTPVVLSSDSLNIRLSLASSLDDGFENSFVFNLAGDLVALVGSDKQVVPAFAYNNYWQRFLAEEKISQPYLGVNYLDLATTRPIGIKLNKGAWLYAANAKPAVLKNSPADEAGLKAGDVITWIDNIEVNADNDLADIVSKYKAGDTITLSYIRAEKEEKMAIELGELK